MPQTFNSGDSEADLLKKILLNSEESVSSGATEETLQAILAKDTSIQIDTAEIDLNTDGLEALGAAGNASTASIDAKTPALGAAAIAASTPVNIANNQVVAISQLSSTGTQTSVASSAVDVLILAANADRKGATISNDGASELHLLLAPGAASLTNHTVVLKVNDAYYEVPYGYTGTIRGIWTVANGSARVTEFT